MSEVPANNTAAHAEGTHVSLVPCAFTDPADSSRAHSYEMRLYQYSGEQGGVIARLGWFGLEAAKRALGPAPYFVRTGSHGLCPGHFRFLLDEGDTT